MPHRILRRAIAGLCLVLGPLAGGTSSAGGTPRTENPLVNRGLDVIEAVAAKDDVALGHLAEDARFDPFDVANSIFVRAIYPKTKPELADRLVTAARWATAVERFPRGAGLPALVAQWAAYGPDELERERRLVIVPIEMASAARKGDLDGVVALAARADSDVVAATSSLNAWGVLVGYAQALEAAGRLDEAFAQYTRSAERAEVLGTWWRASSGWDRAAQGSFASGRFAECRERGERALLASHRAGRDDLVPGQRNNIATALLREGRVPDALAAAERALAEADASAKTEVRARVLITIASIQVVQGDSDAGRRAFAEGIALLAARGTERRELRRVRFAYAQTLLETDAWAPALEAFEGLAAELSPADAATLRLLVPRSLAILLRALGRQPDALAYARQAYDVAREIGEASTVEATKSELVLALSLLGRHDEAIAIVEASGPATPARTVEPAADGAAPGGSRQASLDAAVAAARRAIVGYDAAGLAEFAVDLRRNLARLLLEAGRREEASAELSKIPASADGDAHSRTSFLAAVVAAESALADRRPKDAVVSSRRALAIHRALSRGLSAEDALGTRKDAAAVVDLGLEAAALWSDAEPADRAAAATAAFELAESSRALLLAEGLEHRTSVLWSSLPPELVAADRESRHALESARARAMGLSLASVEDVRGAKASDAAKGGADLAAARRHRDDVLTRIGRESRRVSSFLDPAPPDLGALRALLGPTSAFLEFQDTGNAIFVIIVRKDTIALRRWAGGADLRARFSAWLRLVSTPGASDERAAAKVYDAIWRPLEEELAGVTRVTITSEGALAYLPFDAMVRAENGTNRRLVESVEISYVPSAGVWIALDAERAAVVGDRVLAVGDPDLGPLTASFVRLPGGAEEARNLVERVDTARRSLFLGSDAGVEPVLAALASAGSRFRVAHFACHGTSEPTSVRGAGLILAGGELLDGDRLARARVPAELVTLSACESARGLEARGEGVFGLARSFFLAGASRVVTSGWLVSDRDGRTFMEDFYDAHLGRGLPASTALRAAKLRALSRGGESADPARWATFTLWGLPE